MEYILGACCILTPFVVTAGFLLLFKANAHTWLPTQTPRAIYRTMEQT